MMVETNDQMQSILVKRYDAYNDKKAKQITGAVTYEQKQEQKKEFQTRFTMWLYASRINELYTKANHYCKTLICEINTLLKWKDITKPIHSFLYKSHPNFGEIAPKIQTLHNKLILDGILILPSSHWKLPPLFTKNNDNSYRFPLWEKFMRRIEDTSLKNFCQGKIEDCLFIKDHHGPTKGRCYAYVAYDKETKTTRRIPFHKIIHFYLNIGGTNLKKRSRPSTQCCKQRSEKGNYICINPFHFNHEEKTKRKKKKK